MTSQGIHTARRTRRFALVAAFVVVFGLLLAAASPAHAHDELLGSDPAPGAALDVLPAQLTLTFSGAIATDQGASEVAVTDASGTSLVDGAPSAQDNVLTQPLAGEASGEITVLWKVVSSDGHPISGEFAFTVTAPPEPTPIATPTVTPEPTPSETAAPTQSVEPLPGPPMEAIDMRPWLIGGILLLTAVGGAVVYLLVSRARREKALAENREKALGGAPDPDSAPPTDR